jgi:predicted ester cyclase
VSSVSLNRYDDWEAETNLIASCENACLGYLLFWCITLFSSPIAIPLSNPHLSGEIITMTAETNKTLVKQYLDALNNNDTATLDRLMSPEQAKIAKEQILPFIAACFGNHLLRATNLIAEGDQVAARIESSGTHIGEFYGLPATGNAWTNRGFAIVRIADSRIVELESLFDIENHIGQLGGVIVPKVE